MPLFLWFERHFFILLFLIKADNQYFTCKMKLLWIKIFILGNYLLSSPQIQIYNIIPLRCCGRANISSDYRIFMHRRILKHIYCVSYHCAWRYHRRHHLLYVWQMGNATIPQKIYWKTWVETWKHRQGEDLFWCKSQKDDLAIKDYTRNWNCRDLSCRKCQDPLPQVYKNLFNYLRIAIHNIFSNRFIVWLCI